MTKTIFFFEFYMRSCIYTENRLGVCRQKVCGVVGFLKKISENPKKRRKIDLFWPKTSRQRVGVSKTFVFSDSTQNLQSLTKNLGESDLKRMCTPLFSCFFWKKNHAVENQPLGREKRSQKNYLLRALNRACLKTPGIFWVFCKLKYR